MALAGDPAPLCDLLPDFDQPPVDSDDLPGEVVVDFRKAFIHGSPSPLGSTLLLDSPLSIIAAISAGNCLVGVLALPGAGIGLLGTSTLLFGDSCCHGIAGRGLDCMLDTSSDWRLIGGAWEGGGIGGGAGDLNCIGGLGGITGVG